MISDKKAFVRRSLILLFALSGLSGLIYESLWTHYLKLFLGHAAYAQALVLSIFMGGMAIGAWICSRYSGRWRGLLLWYAVAEGVIGLCALAFHRIFVGLLDVSFGSIIPRLGVPAAVYAYKWGLASLLILPQSVLLGMTFPLMSSGMLRLFPERPGRSIAMLYFANSIGAAMGVLASGFILIRLAGLPGTMHIAGIINIILALTVWALLRAVPPGGEGADRATPGVSDNAGAVGFRILMMTSFLTGAASFIYEMGWIRMLSLVLGITTHAFELMLSSFILGLALGGLWVQRRIDRIGSPVPYLGKVQILMGILALATLFLYGNTFDVMEWLKRSLPRTDAGYMLFNLSSSAIAMSVMLPATFCAGMTLPLITFLLLREGNGEGSIGAVYASNTIGAIAGVMFSIHVGMPHLGLKGLIICGAGVDIALGVLLVWLAAPRLAGTGGRAVVASAGVLVLASSLMFVSFDAYKMASGVYRVGYLLHEKDGKLLYHKDGKTATISTLLEPSGHLAIKTNGKTDAAIMTSPQKGPLHDEVTNVLLGVIPMLFSPGASTAASIGIGSGLTSHTVLSNPGIRMLDTIEIERGVIEAAEAFRPRVELLYTDPRSRIYNDDARTFFSTYNKTYDLIISEPSAVWVSGLAGLFSGEFYGQIKKHMNEEGLFAQWLQLTEVSTDLVASVLKAVASEFSDYAVYSATNGDLIIIARKNGLLPEPDYAVLTHPAIAAELSRIGVAGEQDISVRRIGSRRDLGRFLESFPIRANSDYYPVLDQNVGREVYLVSSAADLTYFTYSPLPLKELLGWSAPRTGETDVTPTGFYTNSRAAYSAMGLRDYFRSGRFAAHVGAEQRQEALRLKKICEGTVVGSEDDRLGTLFNIAVDMIPYLSPSELEPLWKILGSGACAAHSSPREQLWQNLFRAVGRRDAAEMLVDARQLLAREGAIPSQARKYLLASGMVGALAQGDKKESYRLWMQYRARTFEGQHADLLFRILEAESKS